MTEIEWASPAVSDRMAIVDFISDDNPDAALRLMEDIERKASHLAHHPGRGRHGRVKDTRELVVHPN